eukprot:495949-Prorocentrum_lima.AAC.1
MDFIVELVVNIPFIMKAQSAYRPETRNSPVGTNRLAGGNRLVEKNCPGANTANAVIVYSLLEPSTSTVVD